MFSSRISGALEANRLTQQIRLARASGRELIDLTVTNPTAVGIEYPASLLAALADPAAGKYDPHPLGSWNAREAVARDYARRGIPVAAERVALTSSTSEAYSILFKLLCDPAGHSVMVPAPSYPLFDHLTALDGVAACAYPLEYHGRWTLASDGPADGSGRPSSRCCNVSPGMAPDGSAKPRSESSTNHADADRRAALILDEVFADYPLRMASIPAYCRSSPALTFRLGGLSKSVGLPQVKLGWILVDGPDDLVAAALQRLELICDTYLSVSTPVQIAASRLLTDGAVVRERILERVRANDATLRRIVATVPSIEALNADGGWSAVLRVPATRSEEELVLELLERDGVLVHPGFFFDFSHEAFLVVSLLVEPAVFAEGVGRLVARAE